MQCLLHLRLLLNLDDLDSEPCQSFHITTRVYPCSSHHHASPIVRAVLEGI